MHNLPINLAHKFTLFTDIWSPKIIAEMNDYQFKLAKIEGEFTWQPENRGDACGSKGG